MCFLVIYLGSLSAFVASWVVHLIVLVITSMGAPDSLLFCSLSGVPDHSDSMVNFLLIVLIFLLFRRLGFVRSSASGFKGHDEVIS